MHRDREHVGNPGVQPVELFPQSQIQDFELESLKILRPGVDAAPPRGRRSPRQGLAGLISNL